MSLGWGESVYACALGQLASYLLFPSAAGCRMLCIDELYQKASHSHRHQLHFLFYILRTEVLWKLMEEQSKSMVLSASSASW